MPTVCITSGPIGKRKKKKYRLSYFSKSHGRFHFLRLFRNCFLFICGGPRFKRDRSPPCLHSWSLGRGVWQILSNRSKSKLDPALINSNVKAKIARFISQFVGLHTNIQKGALRSLITVLWIAIYWWLKSCFLQQTCPPLACNDPLILVCKTPKRKEVWCKNSGHSTYWPAEFSWVVGMSMHNVWGLQLNALRLLLGVLDVVNTAVLHILVS